MPRHKPAQDADGPSDASSIATRASRGGAIFVSRTLLVQVLQVGSSLLIARLVAPDAFGVVAIALSSVGAMRLVHDCGVLFFLTVQREVDPRDERAAMALTLGISLVFAVLCVPVGLLLMPTTSAGELSEWFLPVLGSTLVIFALRQTALLRLQRQMAYGRLGVIALAETVTAYVVQVGLLFAGLNVWSIILAQIPSALLGTVLLTRAGREFAPPGQLSRIPALVRGGIPFQLPLIISTSVGFVSPIIVLQALDTHDLGLWSWSTILAGPITAILFGIHQVLTPSLARLRRFDDSKSDEAAEMFLRLLLLVASIAAGTLIGLSEPIIEIVFGDRWVPAVDAVRITLLAVVPTAWAFVLVARLEILNRMAARVRVSLIAGTTVLVVMYPLAHFGGVAGAAAASALLLPVLEVRFLSSMAEVRMRRAAIAAALGLLSTAGVGFGAATFVEGFPSLVVAGVVTGVAAVVLAFAIDGAILRRAYAIARGTRKDDAEAVPTSA